MNGIWLEISCPVYLPGTGRIREHIIYGQPMRPHQEDELHKAMEVIREALQAGF